MVRTMGAFALVVLSCRGTVVVDLPAERCAAGAECLEVEGSPAVCGNGVVEPGEQCDDGNAWNDDGCAASCVELRDLGQLCDFNHPCRDGLTCDEVCKPPYAKCGNGEVEPGEQCDPGAEGISTASCDADCTLPSCGDGVVNQAVGECCDPGKEDGCNPTCDGPYDLAGCETSMDPMGPICAQDYFAGVVTNNWSPTMPGDGIPAVWSYGGQLGTLAGHDMCAAIGGDHVCSYWEVEAARAQGELVGKLPDGTYWVNRILATVTVHGSPSPPGPGGRCNDWTYPTNHIADGEHVEVSENGTAFDYHFDQNTAYTGNAVDGAQGNGAYDGGPCGGPKRGLICCHPCEYF